MSLLRLIFSGVRFHWRAHLGAFLGALLCTAVLTGALFVADSLKGTLRFQAEARVGFVKTALSGGEKLFRSALASAVARDAAPVLLLQGSLVKSDGAGRLKQGSGAGSGWTVLGIGSSGGSA